MQKKEKSDRHLNRSAILEHCSTHVETLGCITVGMDDAGRGSEDSRKNGGNCEDVEEDGKHLVLEGGGEWRDNQEQDPRVRNDSKLGEEEFSNHQHFNTDQAYVSVQE